MSLGWQFRDQCLPDYNAVKFAILGLYPVATGDSSAGVLTVSDFNATIGQYSITSQKLVVRVFAEYSPPNVTYSEYGLYQWYTFPVCDTANYPDTGAAVTAQDAATIAALQTTVASLQSTVASTAAAQTATQTGVQTLLNAEAEPFDSSYAWGAFSFFFGVTLAFWILSKKIGVVMLAIRNKFPM